jgi:hypothetical protein
VVVHKRKQEPQTNRAMVVKWDVKRAQWQHANVTQPERNAPDKLVVVDCSVPHITRQEDGIAIKPTKQ